MTFSAVCALATLDAASSAAAYETTTCSRFIIIIMSAKTGKRPLRSLTAHEKLDAIRRVHDGESKASVARDIGVPESTLRGWCKNEDKISYLSRQSSPDTDESLDQVKKPKLEEPPSQPFNLSLKSTSPDLKKDNNKSLSTTTSTTERERNRAELARLSVELGLNRPEMFIPSLNNSTTQANLQDLSTNLTLLNQWNTLLMQQQKNNSIQKKVNTAPADTSTGTVSSSSNNLLITTDNCDNKSKLLPKDIKQPTVQESVWYWLKTQQTMLGLNPTTNGTTPTSTSVTNTSPDQSSWFWRWYKQFAYQQLTQQQDNKPILYQQLTKETTPDQQNAENLSLKDNSTRQEQKSPNKVRSVLDNLLFNNNNNNVSTNSAKEESVLSQTEAVEHGEKFLRWLETCSDPSVTAMQIMQFRTLLNNVKSVAERKNGDNVQNNKAKVKRK